MRKIMLGAAVCAAAVTAVANAAVESFPNGLTWPDTDGVHINCHGGCVVESDGAYYWFGESRTGGHSDGISVYRSKDLYNWENLGFAVTHQGERDDENLQDISEGRLLERPKVIYNAKTGKWVMWAHWENGNDYGEARVAILQSDKLTGPYTFVKTMRPNGHDSRDQTLFLDTDGNAYHLCSTNMNTDINLVRLSDDFLDVTENEQYIMKGRRLEASTVCKAGETYFATFSECDGWNPAPGHTATAVGDMLGEWTEGLNFCVDPNEKTSYRSQGAYVFSVGGLGYDPKCFIFYGDRWNSSNVGASTYVWLPLSVRSGYPTVRDYTTWDLDEVMKDMYRFKRAAAIEAGNTYSLLDCASNRLMTKTGVYSGFNITSDDDKALRIVFESAGDPYKWVLKDAATGRYLAVNEGKLRQVTDKNSENAVWTFVLLPDGYYKVFNEPSGLCMGVAASNRNEGAAVELSAFRDDDTQKFGVYFDSYNFDYTEADMYSKKYFEEVAAEIAKQNFKYTPSEDNSFVAGEKVQISQVISGLVVTLAGLEEKTAGRLPTISSNYKNDNQIVTFTKAPEGDGLYNICDNRGYYLYKTSDDTWTGSWANTEELAELEFDLSSPEVCFSVTPGDGGYHIVSEKTGKWFGTDSYDNNAIVYLDKTSGLATVFTFINPDEVKPVTARELFLNLFDEVDVVLGAISEEMVGDDAFDYSRTAYDRLSAAFAHALEVTDNYEKELETLEAAYTYFKEHTLVYPHPANTYYIVHASGRHIDMMDEKGPSLGVEDGEDTPQYRFIYDEELGGWAIRHEESGLFLAKNTTNSWDMDWREEAGSKRTLWDVEWTPLGCKGIRNLQTKGYIGADETVYGAALYANKGISEANSQWQILLADNSGVDGVVSGNRLSVIPGRGSVRVCGATSGVAVYTVLGTCVARESGDDVQLTLPAGIYVVTASDGDNMVSRQVVVK